MLQGSHGLPYQKFSSNISKIKFSDFPKPRMTIFPKATKILFLERQSFQKENVSRNSPKYFLGQNNLLKLKTQQKIFHKKSQTS